MTKVLIIEDDKDNMELMVYLLNHHGFTTVSAADGQMGVSMAQQEKPDLIICGVQLRILNGFEVVKLLKRDEQLKKIPIIAVTAYAMVGDRDKIRAAGFDAYMAKPIIPMQFVTQIETLLPEKLRSNKQLKLQTGYEQTPKEQHAEDREVALIVDNFSAHRELSKNLIESVGMDVIAVQGVKEALDVLQKRIPDLILSDLIFPESSGLEFLRLIRGNERWKSIPFIIASATHPTEQDIKQIRELDVKRFILLPINSDAFVSIIQNIHDSIRKVH